LGNLTVEKPVTLGTQGLQVVLKDTPLQLPIYGETVASVYMTPNVKRQLDRT